MPGSSQRILVYRGAKEICAVIGEDPRRITSLVEIEGLPAWKRNGDGVWRALPDDLIDWLHEQRQKYLKKES